MWKYCRCKKSGMIFLTWPLFAIFIMAVPSFQLSLVRPPGVNSWGETIDDPARISYAISMFFPVFIYLIINIIAFFVRVSPLFRANRRGTGGFFSDVANSILDKLPHVHI